MTDKDRAAGALQPHPYALLLPPLNAGEYAALKANVARFGILHAVITDETGRVLDGVHRCRIARELGLTPPVSRLGHLGEHEKLELAVGVNVRRRHLDPDRRRELVLKLRDEQHLSVRDIAAVTGWSKSTVGRDLTPPAPPVADEPATPDERIAAAEHAAVERIRARGETSEHLVKAAGLLARGDAIGREQRRFGMELLADAERDDDPEAREVATLMIRLGGMDPWHDEHDAVLERLQALLDEHDVAVPDGTGD